MPKLIFQSLRTLTLFVLLMCLALPFTSNADQVEVIQDNESSGEAVTISSTDQSSSTWKRLRVLIGLDRETPVVSASIEQTPAEIAPEIKSSKIPAITATAETVAAEEPAVNGSEQNRSVDENAALDKLKAEKIELEQMASKKTEQIRFAEEKIAAEKAERLRLAAEKAELKRIADLRAAEEIIAADKARSLRASSTAPATTQQIQQPSSWQNVLSLVGLHDNRPAIPPMELKNSPILLGQDYIIGPGDVIGISVWRDESLTRTAVVLPDGKIQFPLIGEIVAGGKSVLQLKQEFVEKLSTYVVDTDISVDVKQSNSLVVYIIGKVNNPGRQILVSNTSVLQALSMAGGLNLFADKDDIKIFRQNNDRTVVYSFRYSKVVSGTYLDDNIMLKRGDVIVVP